MTPSSNMRSAVVQILRSRINAYSHAEDVAPSVQNAEEVADLILKVCFPSEEKCPHCGSSDKEHHWGYCGA